MGAARFFLRVCVRSSGCGQRCCRGVGLAGVCVVVHGRNQMLHVYFYWCSRIVIKALKPVCWLTGEYLQLQYRLSFSY